MYIYIYYTSFSRDFHHLNLVSYWLRWRGFVTGPALQHWQAADSVAVCCRRLFSSLTRHLVLDKQCPICKTPIDIMVGCPENQLFAQWFVQQICRHGNSVEDFAHIYIYLCSIICWMNHIDMDDNPSTGTGGAWWSTTRRPPIRQALHRWHAQVITGMVQCQILKKNLASHGNCMEL